MLKRTGQTRGFTLTEMLAALLVLALFGGLVVTGVNIALNVKEDTKFISDSDVLASTINTALADCIHYNGTVQNQGGVWLHGMNITGATLDVDGDGHFVVKGTFSGSPVEERLLNAGVYGDLKISTTETYSTDFSGGVKYTIVGNTNKPNQTKDVEVSYAKLTE